MADGFMDAIYKGDLSREMRERSESRNRMAPDIQPALQGDTAALGRVFQANPDTGARIAQFVGQMDANKRRSLTEYTDFIARDGMGILQAPAAARPQLYAQTLELARQRGYDVSGMPPEYGPDAETKLKFHVQRALPFATALKRMGAGGGGGGAPAPAAGGWGGPPAPRVSDAGSAPGGPMVADAPPPPASPTMAPGGQPTAPMPQMAGAGPMPMAMSPAPQGAPQAPAQPFQAPAGPMLAQTQPAPPAAPQPAPAPVQVAGGGDIPDDSGDGQYVGGPDAERVFRLNPGESIKVAPKDGKPLVDGGGVWVQAKDGSVEWRLLDPQGRPIRVQTVDLGDRIGVIGPGGEVIREIPKGRAPGGPPRVQTVDLGDRIGVVGPDGQIEREIPKGRQPKPVDNSGRDDLTKVGTPALEVSALFRDFKDDYGGYRVGMIGGMDNMRRRNFGDETGQAQWWQRYDATANVIRNQLFGSALTATEKAAFEAAMINPGMDPGEIKKNLGRQRAIMLRAAARMAGGMIKGGANQDEVEQYLGLRVKELPGAFDDVPTSGTVTVPMPGGGAPAPGGGAAPKRLRFNPNTGELE